LTPLLLWRSMKLLPFATPLLLSLLAGCSSMSFDDLNSMSGINRPSVGNIDVGKALSAGKDLADAAMLDDQQVQALATQFATSLDKSARVAPPSSKYAIRLKKITNGLQNEDGLKLNFKAYISPEVNAFSLADGTIRVHSGLMDKCTDEEILAVIGHEIGHVKLGHSKSRVQIAHAASGVIKGAGSMNNLAGTVASTELVGGTLDKLVNAQFSQSNEMDSDDYSVTFLQRHGKSPQEMVGALNVLAKLQDEAGKDPKAFRFFSTHPGPGARAERLQEEISSGNLKPIGSTKQAKSPDRKPVTAEVADTNVDESDSVSAIEPQERTRISRVVKTERRATTIGQASVQVIRSPQPGYYVQMVAQPNPVEANAMVEQLKSAALRVTTQTAVVNGIKYTRVLVGPYQTLNKAKAQLVNLSGGAFTEEAPFIQRVK
jgi:putative metalloprotease